MKEVSVVVVDDDQMMRSLMSGILRSEEYHVVGEAASSATALKMCQEARPALILLDINLPDMSGLELLSSLKQIEPAPKIVMVSGEATLDRVKEALTKGAAGFVVKPFNAAKLLAAVTKVIPSPKAAKQGFR